MEGVFVVESIVSSQTRTTLIRCFNPMTVKVPLMMQVNYRDFSVFRVLYIMLINLLRGLLLVEQSIRGDH